MYVHEYIRMSTLNYQCKHYSLKLKHKLFDKCVIGYDISLNIILGVVLHEEIEKGIECQARKMDEAMK